VIYGVFMDDPSWICGTLMGYLLHLVSSVHSLSRVLIETLCIMTRRFSTSNSMSLLLQVWDTSVRSKLYMYLLLHGSF